LPIVQRARRCRARVVIGATATVGLGELHRLVITVLIDLVDERLHTVATTGRTVGGAAVVNSGEDAFPRGSSRSKFSRSRNLVDRVEQPSHARR